MKTFEEFMKALETDDALKAKVKEALVSGEVKSEEAKIDMLVKIAAENGFNVSVEDFSKRQSAVRELDDDELKLITGAGVEFCFFDYGCGFVWNTCVVSDESVCNHLQTSCNNNLFD